MTKNEKTAGDLLFEQYLRTHCFHDFEYEPDCPLTTKQPDYGVPIGEAVALFEIKELNTPWPKAPVGSFDPYRPIRSMINTAQKQFKGLKGEMCSVVLTNPHNAFAHLDPLIVCGAMLGNAGFSMPFNPARGSFDDTQTRRVFSGSGKMFQYVDGKAIAPWKTTISAVCALGYCNIESWLLNIRVAEEKRRLSVGRLSPKQLSRIYQEVKRTETDSDNRHLRIIVCENPFAVTPLDDAFGSGPYDERYGPSSGEIVRRYVGDSLRLLEEQGRKAGLKPRLLGGFG